MSSDVRGEPAASKMLIASLKHLTASLKACFLKCMLPRSFNTVSLSSSSLKVLSSFGGLGVSSVFRMVTDGSAFLGTGSTLGLATGVSAGVAMGLLLANSS